MTKEEAEVILTRPAEQAAECLRRCLESQMLQGQLEQMMRDSETYSRLRMRMRMAERRFPLLDLL